MVSRLNLYQAIFAALLILKIGEVEPYSGFSWFVVISPLIIGSINNYLWGLFQATGIPARAKEAMLNMYVEDLKKRVVRRELNKLRKEQSRK